MPGIAMLDWLTRDPSTLPLKLCSTGLLMLLLMLAYERGREPTLIDEIISRAEVIHVAGLSNYAKLNPDTSRLRGRLRLADGLESNVMFRLPAPVEGQFLPVRVRHYANGERRIVYRRH